MTTPVVFLHGTRSSSEVWNEQVAELQRHGVEGIAVDFPGHGTRKDERFTMEGALATVDAAVDTCSEPPLLVGLSLGGYTALQYADQHPEKLAGVMAVACATPPRRRPLKFFRGVTEKLNKHFGVGGPTWNVVLDMLNAVAPLKPLGTLRRTELPMWLVAGSHDPLRIGSRLYRWANPRASWRVIHGAGHDANLHQPQRFNEGLLSALASLPKPKLPSLPSLPALPSLPKLPGTRGSSAPAA